MLASLVEKTIRFLDDEEAQNARLPAQLRSQLARERCDKVLPGFGEFGRDLNNPVPVNGVLGELIYLSSLQTHSGIPLCFHRIGSSNSIDIFETCSYDGGRWDVLYLSPYFPSKSRFAPEGYVIDRTHSRNMMKGTTLEIGEFPKFVCQGALECSKRLLGIAITDLRLKQFESDPIRPRPSQHLDLLADIKYTDKSFIGPDGAVTSLGRDSCLTAIFEESAVTTMAAVKSSNELWPTTLNASFEEEIGYLILSTMVIAVFATTRPAGNAAATADQLVLTVLKQLAKGRDIGPFRRRYVQRFETLRELDFIRTKEEFNVNELSLHIGRWLSGENDMLLGMTCYGHLGIAFQGIVEAIKQMRPESDRASE